MIRNWIPLLAALACSVPAVSFDLPGSPDDVACPAGSTRLQEGRASLRIVGCVRGDGRRIGPHTEWYPDGKLHRFHAYLDRGERPPLHGLDVGFNPDGSLSWERYHENGKPTGRHHLRDEEGAYYSEVYEAGHLLDVFSGRERPAFKCPKGLTVRTRRNSSQSYGLGEFAPRPAIERWCEDRREIQLIPLTEADRFVPERVDCVVTAEGIIQTSIGNGGRQDRLSLPEGVDPSDEEGLANLCSDPGFWRDRQREGPYVSRSVRGRPMETGVYRDGRRHGVWEVLGRACVGYDFGTHRGRVPCDLATPTRDRGIEARWNEIDVARRRLDWPRIGETRTGRELRIWRFFGSSGGYLGRDARGSGPFALRLINPESDLQGEFATWSRGLTNVEDCHRSTDDQVCAFLTPAGWTWEDVLYELDLLDVWTIPASHDLRVPSVVGRNPSPGQEGFLLEVAEDGRVRRDWYGPVEYEPAPDSHQVRGIASLMDQVWRHTLREPPPVPTPVEPLPCDPWVELTSKTQEVYVGESFHFRVRARARHGLSSITWFGQSGPNPVGRYGSFSGRRARQFESEATTAFRKPGTAVLSANARDWRYGLHFGAPHQASEGCGLATLSVEVLGSE